MGKKAVTVVTTTKVQPMATEAQAILGSQRMDSKDRLEEEEKKEPLKKDEGGLPEEFVEEQKITGDIV